MTWNLDTVHTHVGFSVKHMVIATARGQFKTFSGTLDIDQNDFTKSSVVGEIDVASIDTGNADRDNHLRTNDFFDVANHPKITFKSTSIAKKGDDYVVTGDLTIRGVTKSVDLDVEFNGVTKSLYGQTVAGLTVRGSINRKDFGVAFHAALETGGLVVADKVNIEINAEAVAA